MVTENEKSQFNDALGFLKDLRTYFRMANMFRSNSDIYNWLDQLINLYTELNNFVPDKDKEEKLKEIKRLRSEVDLYVNRQNQNPTTKRVPIALYWDIYNFHIYVKEIYGKSGLETRMLDSALEALR